MKKSTKIRLGILYWIISLTWGGLMTIPGLLVTAFCIIFLKGKPHRNGFSYIVEVGGNWGGLELGAVSLMGSYYQKDRGCYSPQWADHTRKHEFGHSIQNIIFGPLYLFVVGIPSACRYWYDQLEKKHKDERKGDWYDSIWFEGTATKWGTALVELIEKVDLPETKEEVKKPLNEVVNSNNNAQQTQKPIDSSSDLESSI